MKLTKELKAKIDHYFNKITPEELYQTSLEYGFKECSDLTNQSFEIIGQNIYCPNIDISVDALSHTSLPLAA